MVSGEQGSTAEAALIWVDIAKGLAETATGSATRDAARRMCAREALWDACLRWGHLMGHPLAAALLADHVAILSAFVDAAVRRDSVSMASLLSAALQNTEDQGRLYSADAPGFPGEAWKEAMVLHIARTASYCDALCAGRMSAFTDAFAKASEARDALAAFWMARFSVKSPSQTPGAIGEKPGTGGR